MNKIEAIVKLILLILFIGGIILLFTGGCHGLFTTPSKQTLIDTEPAARLAKSMLQVNWLVTASIVGAALSFAGVLQGSKLAQAILLACVMSLGLSLAAIRYAEWLAIGSLVSAGCIMLATVLAKGKAIKELIIGIQNVKKDYKSAGAVATTKDGINYTLSSNQSKSTQSIVQQIKGKLKVKGIL